MDTIKNLDSAAVAAGNGLGFLDLLLDRIGDPSLAAGLSATQQQSLAHVLVAAAATVDDSSLGNLWALGAMHRSPFVRSAIVQLAAQRCATSPGADELLIWAIHDDEDAIAIRAMLACRDCSLTDAIAEIHSWVGRMGTIDLAASLGTCDLRGRTGLSVLRDLAQSCGDDTAHAILENAGLDPRAETPRSVDLFGMVLIPAGSYRVGLGEPPGWARPGYLDHVLTSRTVDLPSFYIDVEPISRAQYFEFLASVQQHGHAWCHPNETPDLDHTPVDWTERRGQSGLPVTGVSWFDAFAYASWAGKRLPSDLEWEVAARGPSTFLYPWGNEPDIRFEPAPNVVESDLGHVLMAAEGGGEQNDLANDRTSVSPFGVSNLVGNIWEWTRSRYLDGGDVAPQYASQSTEEALGNWDMIVCIKGGAPGCEPEQLLAAYRGRRYARQRGPDTGLRCVAGGLV